MPPMKIQPVGFETRLPDLAKPAQRSRLKKLFDRPFPSVLRISSAYVGEKAAAAAEETQDGRDCGELLEPSSVCLAKMVQNFMEDSNEKQSAAKCIRKRCNCFNGNGNESSDDEMDGSGGGEPGDPSGDIVKGLVQCTTAAERNLLADTANIIDKNKNLRRKDQLRKIVSDSLSSIGYDSSICKSKWDKTPSFPAGEYEYIDVIVKGERLLIDIDFRSEFEIARSTVQYRAILHSLPFIFVGKTDRLSQIVRIVSDAATRNLKKRGMHIPPWRKAEYMQAKWVSPYTRSLASAAESRVPGAKTRRDSSWSGSEDSSAADGLNFQLVSLKDAIAISPSVAGDGKKLSPEWVDVAVVMQMWQPPAVKPKCVDKGTRVVTGLASLLRDRP